MPERYQNGYATLITQHEQQHQQDDEHTHVWCECPGTGFCQCGRTICATCGAWQEDSADG